MSAQVVKIFGWLRLGVVRLGAWKLPGGTVAGLSVMELR